VVVPAVKQQRRRRVQVPRTVRYIPLRALGRVPMAPGPAADEDADQQPSAQREWSIIDSDEIPVPSALPYACVAAMILTFSFFVRGADEATSFTDQITFPMNFIMNHDEIIYRNDLKKGDARARTCPHHVQSRFELMIS
jgi:hypothetical protein